MRNSNFAYLIMSLFLIAIVACKKDPVDPCIGVTVSITSTITNTSNIGLSDGSIAATATGGSGFAYRINGGSYQASGTFSGLAKGTYKIDAISKDGCTGTAQFTVGEINLCGSVNLAFTTTTTTVTDPCVAAATGGIAITASGSSGYTYSLNGGAAQSTGTFNNLAVGTYNFEVKDTKGCKITGTASVAAAAPGAKYAAAKAVIQARCVGCHSGASPRGKKDFSVDCTVVATKDRIKIRAVDEGTMPTTAGGGPLSQADKDKITAWISAGGKYTD